jgi:streptomycin 6-kinase
VSDDRPDLAALARVALDVAADWGLELGTPFTLSRYSLVAPTHDGSVLKVTPPEDDESDEEGEALELWAGHGAVRLLRRDRARRALLLERLTPGTDLSELPEDEATAITVDLGRALWQPAAQPFRWIGDHVPRWLDNAEREGGPGTELIPLARDLYAGLGEVGRATLVHGDLHHHNVLAGGDRFLAIDPKPMLGEPEFDVAAFLWNPLHYRMTPEVSERRIAAFVAAGLDGERVRAWALIRGSYLGAEPDEAAVLRSLVT